MNAKHYFTILQQEFPNEDLLPFGYVLGFWALLQTLATFRSRSQQTSRTSLTPCHLANFKTKEISIRLPTAKKRPHGHDFKSRPGVLWGRDPFWIPPITM